MDRETARRVVDAEDPGKPSEIAEAVAVLYQEYGTYQSLTRYIGKSDRFWIVRHRISQLPVGILWKIDEGQIGIEQGYQLTRLPHDADQWRLAIAMVEVKQLTAKECRKVVNLVINEGKPMTEALRILAGIRFDKIQPLLLPLRSDLWVAICKIAWTQCQKWEDLCYQLVLQAIDVDIQEVASDLEKLASELRHAGRSSQAGEGGNPPPTP